MTLRSLPFLPFFLDFCVARNPLTSSADVSKGIAPRSILSLMVVDLTEVSSAAFCLVCCSSSSSDSLSSLVIVFVDTTVAPVGMKGLFNLGFAWMVGLRNTGLNLLNADQPFEQQSVRVK